MRSLKGDGAAAYESSRQGWRMVDEAVGRLVDEPADRVGNIADVGVFKPLISPSLSEEKESGWSLIPSWWGGWE
jgi:hypothetical protein